MRSFFSFKEYISLKVRSNVFPEVPWQIRSKQLWIAVWYEPNQTLEKYHYYTKEYLRSLDNVFNRTISYRNDSFVEPLAYNKGCRYKKNLWLDNSVDDVKWTVFSNTAVSKSR